MNQIFGYQILPGSTPTKDFIFKGVKPAIPLMNADCTPRQIHISASHQAPVQSYYSREHDSYAYVWGIPAHPEIPSPDIAEWCLKAVVEECYDRFKELIGTFIVITDEPRKHSITFVNDILGIRPLFLGRKNGRIVFGSDIWAMQSSGLCGGKIDYDSVSSWIAYGYNCTDGTLFSDLHRLPPGSVVLFQDDKYLEKKYIEFKSEEQKTVPEMVSEEIHEMVSSNIKTLLSNHHRVSLALSGGYDSRYILALSLNKIFTDCFTVNFPEEDSLIAQTVAKVLNIPLRNIPVHGSVWDIYDHVYHYMADGFPISKFVPYRVAQEYPGIPMLNGFMGEALIRGDSDRFMGMYETEWKDDPVDVLQRKHLKICCRLFQKKFAEKILMRSRVPMEKAVREGSRIGKIMGWQDFYYTHRFYISNNFLQHIALAEALLPFYSWSLLSYKMSHAYIIFNMDIYRKIFRTYFPALDRIPHANSLITGKRKSHKSARCTKQWSRQIIPLSGNGKHLSLLNKKWSIPLKVAGIAGIYRAERAIFLFERLYMLEKSARDAGLDFDWECI
ncbi:MAG: hypothetical protein RDU01_02455 [Thermodesulfovibrionales bacterium]|nr:hypothetical protein [Thermodesulfovibrionales bacterium]